MKCVTGSLSDLRPTCTCAPADCFFLDLADGEGPVIGARSGSTAFFDRCTFAASIDPREKGVIYVLSEAQSTIRIQEATVGNFTAGSGYFLSAHDTQAGTFISDKSYQVYYTSGKVTRLTTVTNKQNQQFTLSPDAPWYTNTREVRLCSARSAVHSSAYVRRCESPPTCHRCAAIWRPAASHVRRYMQHLGKPDPRHPATVPFTGNGGTAATTPSTGAGAEAGAAQPKVTAPTEGEEDTGLGGGAIAGIAIGAIFLVAILGAAVLAAIFIMRRQEREQQHKASLDHEASLHGAVRCSDERACVAHVLTHAHSRRRVPRLKRLQCLS